MSSLQKHNAFSLLEYIFAVLLFSLLTYVAHQQIYPLLRQNRNTIEDLEAFFQRTRRERVCTVELGGLSCADKKRMQEIFIDEKQSS
jgi:hypothetical protein